MFSDGFVALTVVVLMVPVGILLVCPEVSSTVLAVGEGAPL
jgi:hypothetical protein